MRHLILTAAGVGLLFAALSFAAETPVAEPAPDIEAALARPVTLQLVDTPLRDVVDFVHQTAGVPTVLATHTLDEIGLSVDTPVTVDLEDVALGDGLAVMLRDLNLTYTVRDNTLVITTVEQADRLVELRVYTIDELLPEPRWHSAEGHRWFVSEASHYEELLDTVRMVAPSDWAGVGEPGRIAPAPTGTGYALVVEQTWNNHREIQSLLDTLHQIARDTRAGTLKTAYPVSLALTNNGRVRQALGKRVTLDFTDVPLTNVADFLAEQVGVPVVVDPGTLGDIGLPLDAPITIRLRDITLRAALEHLLADLNLVYVIRDGVLTITTPEECENFQPLVVYPVGDFAGPMGDIDIDMLMELITSVVQPGSWPVGAVPPGPIWPIQWKDVQAIGVVVPGRVHDGVGRLLEQIRTVTAKRRSERGTQTSASRIPGRLCSDGGHRAAPSFAQRSRSKPPIRERLNPFGEAGDQETGDQTADDDEPAVEEVLPAPPMQFEFDAPKLPDNSPSGRDGIEAALGRRVDLLARNSPLPRLVEALRDHFRINIRVDRRSLDFLPISGDGISVNIIAHDAPLELVLRLGLPTGVGWTIEHDTLLIAPAVEISFRQWPEGTRVHDVTDLVTFIDAEGERFERFEPLDDALDALCDGEIPMTGNIVALRGRAVLISAGTYHEQRWIERILQRLRAARAPDGDPPLMIEPAIEEIPQPELEDLAPEDEATDVNRGLF